MRVHPGMQIDRYRVMTPLGRGGMAEVWLVRHELLGTLHALKLMYSASPGQLMRLLREGRVQSKLRHRHIVEATDIIDVHGQPGLVMAYIEGPTLAALLQARRLSPADVDALARPILSAVAAAHAAGLVHRDLKPGNVLLSVEDGQVVPRVTDFGLAKLLDHADRSANPSGMPPTSSGAAMGTPAYMAPEQIRDSSRVDARADVFALGCILYEMLAGRRAFSGKDSFALFQAIVEGDYRDLRELAPDLDPAMYDAIERALRTDIEERAASAAELRELWIGAREDMPRASSSVREAVTGLTRNLADMEPVDVNAATLQATPAQVSVTLTALPRAPAVSSTGAAPEPSVRGEDAVAAVAVPESSTRARRVWMATGLGLGLAALLAIGGWSLWSSGAREPAIAQRPEQPGPARGVHVLSSDSTAVVFGDPLLQEQFAEGWRAYLAADFRTAERLLANAIASDPPDPLPWVLLAQIRSEVGNEAQSMQAVWTAVERARRFDSPMSTLLPLLRDMAVEGAWAGEVEQGIRAYLEAHPDDLLARLILLDGAAAMADDEVTRLFTRMVERDPKPAVIYHRYAANRLDRGDWSGAREAAAQGLAHNPDHPALLQQRGTAELHLGELEAARETLRASVRLDPGQLQARVDLVGAAVMLSDEALVEELRVTLMGSASSLADKIVFARRHAPVLASVGRRDEAVSLIEAVLEQARRENAWETVIGVQSHLDGLYEVLGDHRARTELLERTRAAMNAPEIASELRQRFAEILIAREGRIAAYSNQPDRARANLERLKAMPGHNPGDRARLEHAIAVAEKRPEGLHPELYRDTCDDQVAYLTSRARAGDEASAARLEALLASPVGCSSYGMGRLVRMRARAVLDEQATAR